MTTEVNINEVENGMIEVNIGRRGYYYYSDFKFHKDDLETVIKYFKHRLKTSRSFYISLYQTSFWRNKLYSKMLHGATYRGTRLSKETLQEVIYALEDLLKPLTKEEINNKLAKKDLVDIIRYAKRVGVVK